MIKNQIKTVVLLTLLAVLLMFIGRLIGGTSGLIIGLVFALGINFVSYWWSDKIVLKIYRAKEADKHEYSHLYTMLEKITHSAKLPMPKLYIINNPQSNAFATGRNPKHAAVAVTTGILNLLNHDELNGVLAHEISHIKNRDILISTIAATIAAVISYVAMMARWAAIFGGMGNRDNRGGGILELLVLAIVAPLMAMIIQFAISRSREYMADESGARLTGHPQHLASALEKIHQNVSHFPLKKMGTTDATAHMFIHSPFKGKSFLELFSTHPNVYKRIKRLEELRI
ncbi:zinc metalloprotease HtpX [Candidatus Woesearchaeota archaeon]|nr:zinc metalloprotease HtpX [Candidatus Woesearchaeota archaeon]